jgi:hypothetical protein
MVPYLHAAGRLTRKRLRENAVRIVAIIGVRSRCEIYWHIKMITNAATFTGNPPYSIPPYSSRIELQLTATGEGWRPDLRSGDGLL